MSLKFTLPEKGTQLDNKLEVTKVKVSELSPSKLNPSGRTKLKSLKGLQRSLTKYGQLEPITIKKQSNTVHKIVNGHRRHASFQNLGWKYIDAIIIDNNIDYDEVFTAMHKDTMKINAVQECERWLKGAKNISPRVMGRIKILQDKLGSTVARSTIKRCVDTNKSPGTIAALIINYEKYVGNEIVHNKESNSKVVYWLLNVSTAWSLSTAMAAFIPINLLVTYINNNKPIPEQWAHNL